jgi:D-arabinose 5-phosphate isomerase GutQ
MLTDLVPLPNTVKGGAIIASSASGQTPAVLDIMRTTRGRKPDIAILGIASSRATPFAELCDVFVGIVEDDNPYRSPLHALADTGEYVISELLDAMVVAAGKRLGLTDEDFRSGHEDLGPTGQYRPKGSR